MTIQSFTIFIKGCSKKKDTPPFHFYIIHIGPPVDDQYSQYQNRGGGGIFLNDHLCGIHLYYVIFVFTYKSNSIVIGYCNDSL